MKAPEIKLKEYDPTYTPGAFGLHNTGVICWFNALVQFMLGIPSFNQTMIENKSILEHNKLATEYISIIENLLPNTEPYETSLEAYSGVSLRLLRALVEMKPGAKLDSGQQCAEEGFTMFLQTIDSKTIDEMFCNVYRQTIDCTRKGCEEQVSNNRDISFHILVPPTKNFRSQKEIEDWKMYASGLPTSHPHRSVISNFRSQSEFQKWIFEHVVNLYGFECPKCAFKQVVAKRKEKVRLLMDVIVIGFDMYDRIDPTWFPQELLFGCSDKVHVVKYKLVGKICWGGTARVDNGMAISSGHYWAHSLRNNVVNGDNTHNNPQWYCLNDSSVGVGNSSPDQYTFMIAYHYDGKIPLSSIVKK